MFANLHAYARLASNKFCKRFPRSARVLGFAHAKRRTLLRVFIIVMHLIGFFQSISAVMETRTPQGAIAWAISLNTIPYVAVPAYAVFGGSDFEAYADSREESLEEIRPMAKGLVEAIEKSSTSEKRNAVSSNTEKLMASLSKLASSPETSGNEVELLINGEETFGSVSFFV